MNKVKVRVFLGVDIRVVNEDLVVLRDVFAALGRLDSTNRITTRDRDKVRRLQEYGIICGSTKCTITSKSKKSKSRDTQDFECINVSDLEILAVQFEPSRESEALEIWISFMKFVKDLLVLGEVNRFIVQDKEHQKAAITRIYEKDGDPQKTNTMVNLIMGDLIGINDYISKDELRQYQNQTTIDLLEVREYVLDKFANAYEFTRDEYIARDMAKKLAFEKYPILIEG